MRVPTLSTLLKHSLGILSQGNKTGRRNKRNIIGREEVKLSLFSGDIILYIKDPKNSTKKTSQTL
jgi:hypothetical protein